MLETVARTAESAESAKVRPVRITRPVVFRPLPGISDAPMDKLKIRGGVSLAGEIPISGAKNAALPILCAGLLTADDLIVDNVPQLQDVSTALKLLRQMGVVAERDGGTVRLNAAAVTHPEAPYELVKTMRAAILVLGPLVARFGRARVSLPGGCAIGARPVDQHIKGLELMGASIHIEGGYLIAEATRLKGTRIVTDMVTVTGTENLMMAATLADGETVIENAAREPEVGDLANALIAMGARIHGAGTDRIVVQGVERLHGARHRVMPDRIETGTFLCAVAAAGGDVLLRGAAPATLDAVLDKLREAGAKLECAADSIRVRMTGRPRAVSLRTAPYPAFPTDMQAQFMALDCIADGVGRITRDDLREPVHARSGTAAAGREHCDRGQHRGRAGHRSPGRCAGDGHRPAGVGQPGGRGPGRPGRDADRSHLPSGSWLRSHGSQAGAGGRPHRAREVTANGSYVITLALSKGRIFDESQPLLAAAGIAPLEDLETSRKLIIGTQDPGLRLVVVRASDVPTYVQYGAAELGVAGKDVLLEHSAQWGDLGLYQPLDLNIARCRLCVAVPAGFDYANAVRRGARLRVATKYVQTAREHFAAKGVHVDLIKLYGSMELAPLAGLADAIVDLVSSGGTLRANNLVEVEEVAAISSRLIVNQSAFKTRRAELAPLIARIEAAVQR